MKRRQIYMTPGQLSVAMAQRGWDAAQTADRLGQRRERVLDWLHDSQPIPRWLPLFFTALTIPDALERVEFVHKHLNTLEHNS